MLDLENLDLYLKDLSLDSYSKPNKNENKSVVVFFEEKKNLFLKVLQ